MSKLRWAAVVLMAVSGGVLFYIQLRLDEPEGSPEMARDPQDWDTRTVLVIETYLEGRWRQIKHTSGTIKETRRKP